MDYTKNYHLPQWVKEDRIMMEDFNQMCADIESGITTAQNTAETAQAAADTAQTAAEAAKSAADQLPYVIGTYKGTGEEIFIEVGFQPRFIIVSAMQTNLNASSTSSYVTYFSISGSTAMRNRFKLSETGFTITPSASGYGLHPNLTEVNRNYDYIAFR